MTPDQELLAALRAYYDAKGIGATSFRCRHFAHCRSLSPRFTTAQETYVGPRYADGPRLLFLSLDSPTLESDPEERTLERVRIRTLTWDIHTFNKRHQWYQTNEMARRLLAPFVPGIGIETAVRSFAHANSAKCSVHNRHSSEAPAILFDNCREFIPGEIRVLRPYILVTQGDKAKRIGQLFPPREVSLKSTCEKCQARIINIDADHQAIWLHCYHTGARGGLFIEQKNRCWSHYEQAVVEFLGGRLAPAGEECSSPLPRAPRQATALPATVQRETPTGKDIFVWVNSCDAGWVIHGRARSSEQRANNVAVLLRLEQDWETLASAGRPTAKQPRADAPDARLAMKSPAMKKPK